MALFDFLKKAELTRISELEQENKDLQSMACPDAQQLF